MDEQISFKTRVRNTLVSCAPLYYSQFVCRDYLVMSDAFSKNPYYVISAEKDNYLHLTGVTTALSAEVFFDKCLDGSITEADFELTTHGQDEKASKGSIRRKIKSLPMIGNLLTSGSTVEEGFQKNKVFCSLASSDGSCTMGFIAVPKARPKTLLIGNELDESKSAPLKIVLYKGRGDSSFSSVKLGSDADLISAFDSIHELLDDALSSRLSAMIKDAEEKRAETSENSQNSEDAVSADESCTE